MTADDIDTIAVRAFTKAPGNNAPPSTRRGLDEPSDWVLVFDTETRTDPSQALRVGCYRLFKGGQLREEGLFYPPGDLCAQDEAVLKRYCKRNKLALRTLADFNQAIFLTIAHQLNGTIIGFNLPFDISRIAIHSGPARRFRDKKTGRWRGLSGGFSFQLVKDRRSPRVKVKHLSRRASLIQLAPGWVGLTPSGMVSQGLEIPHHPGFFVDVKTLAAALTSRSHALESLCRALKVPTQKTASEEHGGPLTDLYLDYARTDVQATYECYQALLAMYGEHGLATPPHRIISEASIGKAYLGELGIQPMQACQDTPPEMLGLIMSTFYGGRAEVRMRRVPTEVIYSDFKSMYPTVNALMGLWEFVIADGFSWTDATLETRAFLERLQPEDFQRPATWRDLTVLVKVRPDRDLLPVRAKYDPSPKGMKTIGLNYLSFDGGLWYTLADVAAAKVLTGKTPEVIEAIRFAPGQPQSGLKPFNLFGKPAYRVDPRNEDVFKRFIDLRDEAKASNDPNEKQIKILANSTSYGIFIEVQRDNLSKPEPLEVYGPDGVVGQFSTTAIENPGKHFHPLLGTLITGAARLMLALAEHQALEQGLGWAFCDTDSLAIACPDGMERDDFRERAQRVLKWFEPLNPYSKPGSILQVEDVNFAADDAETLEPLYVFAISAKRYALFNIDALGRPILRKASAHALGHLIPPYGEYDPAQRVPEPVLPLSQIGVPRWQYDLWYMIVKAALDGHPNQVPLDYHPALKKPAVSRYGATSPETLNWMRHYNADRAYSDQVRPFGFMVSFTALSPTEQSMPERIGANPRQRGRPKKARRLKPIAPFERDPLDAALQTFDRETGEPVPLSMLRTYADDLARYHLGSEWKFENGEFLESGETRRRHIRAKKIQLIGKEANAIDPDGPLYPADRNDQLEFDPEV